MTSVQGRSILAEDVPDHLPDLALRIARLAPKPPILSILTPVPVGSAAIIEKRLRDASLRATIVSQPVFFTPGCAVEDFNWPDRITSGITKASVPSETRMNTGENR